MDRFRPTTRTLAAMILTASFLGIACLAPRIGLADIDAWPLLEIDEDTTTVAYPFFVIDGDLQMFFPLYYRTNEARDHHLLWPLVKVSDGKLTRVAPFYFSAQDDRFTLFPLIHQTRDSTWWLFPPIYLSRDDEFHAVFPLYAHAERTTWIAPNLRLDLNDAGDLTRVRSFGVFDWQRSGAQSELDALWIAGYKRGGTRTHTRFLPLFSVTKSPSLSSTWVGPVNYADGTDAMGRDLSRVCVLPLFCYDERGDLRKRFVGPWYDWQTEKRRSKGVFGLIGTRREVAPDGNETHELSLLAWSYSRKIVRSNEGDLIERRRRFLVFTDRMSPEGRSFAILGFPIWEEIAARSKGTI